MTEVRELNTLAKNIFEQNKAKGFWPDNPNDRNVGELLMLIVSEAAEALEASRDGKYANPIDVAQLEMIESHIGLYPDNKEYYEKQWVDFFKANIKNSFEDEIADTIIRLFDLCGAKGIDIEWHIAKKLRYNKTRPHKHGRAF